MNKYAILLLLSVGLASCCNTSQVAVSKGIGTTPTSIELECRRQESSHPTSKANPGQHTKRASRNLARSKGDIPISIRAALERLPRVSPKTPDLIKFLGLRSPGEDPITRDISGNTHSFWERWNIGFKDSYVLEVSGFYPTQADGSARLTPVWTQIEIGKKTNTTDAFGDVVYKPLNPSWHSYHELLQH
jgi:hypothetical protein